MQLSRMHTAPSEMFGLALAGYIGGMRLPQLLLLVLLGWMVHVAGFGMNSLVDYLHGYDAADPSKRHHPLPSGRLTVAQAMSFVFAMQLASVFYFMILSRSYIADAAFAAYVASGWIYNLTAKEHKVPAMFELGVSMGALFLAGAALLGILNPTIILASIYTGIVAVYQIGVDGDLKDLDARTPERNVLRDLGTYVDDSGTMHTSRGGYALALSVSAAKAVAFALVAATISPIWGIAMGAMGAITFTYFALAMMRPGPFDHARRLKIIGLCEVWSYVALVIALFPLMLSWAPIAVALYLVAPVAYYYAMNRIMWPETGSGWAPGV
ncbi:MAG: UbiA family prenyltransferase [Anaerolineae bacterium]